MEVINNKTPQKIEFYKSVLSTEELKQVDELIESAIKDIRDEQINEINNPKEYLDAYIKLTSNKHGKDCIDKQYEKRLRKLVDMNKKERNLLVKETKNKHIELDENYLLSIYEEVYRKIDRYMPIFLSKEE